MSVEQTVLEGIYVFILYNRVAVLTPCELTDAKAVRSDEKQILNRSSSVLILHLCHCMYTQIL